MKWWKAIFIHKDLYKYCFPPLHSFTNLFIFFKPAYRTPYAAYVKKL